MIRSANAVVLLLGLIGGASAQWNIDRPEYPTQPNEGCTPGLIAASSCPVRMECFRDENFPNGGRCDCTNALCDCMHTYQCVTEHSLCFKQATLFGTSIRGSFPSTIRNGTMASPRATAKAITCRGSLKRGCSTFRSSCFWWHFSTRTWSCFWNSSVPGRSDGMPGRTAFSSCSGPASAVYS